MTSIQSNITNASLKDRFEESAQTNRDRLALVTLEKKLTYKQLNAAANHLAYQLLEVCTDQPQTIGIFQQDVILSIVSMLAIFKAGKTAVILDAESPVLYSKEIAQDAQLSLIITHPDLKRDAAQIYGEENLIFFFEPNTESELQNPIIIVSPKSIARILYTSGSTGKPRGCFHDQRFFLHSAEVFRQSQQITPEDRQLLVSPIQHMSGTNILNRTLLIGATLYAYPIKRKGVEGLPEWIHENAITLLQLVPTLFRRLIAKMNSDELLESVRLLHLGGEAVTIDDLKLFRKFFSPECHFLQNLGSTELSSYRQFHLRPQNEIPKSSVPAGVSVPDKHLTILKEDGSEAAINESGEMIVRTRFMVRSYTNEGPSISEALIRFESEEIIEKEFPTGDLGRIDENGILFHEGRKGHQIKIHGHRVEIKEIETELRRHPAINEAVVNVFQKTNKVPVIVAYFTSCQKDDTFSTQLRTWLSERLPSYMVPMECTQLESLPQLSSGKIDFNALPIPVQLKEPSETNFQQIPSDELELELIKIWEELFKKKNLTLKDDFIMLGGDSMLAVELACMIEERLGYNMTAEILVHSRNIEQLAHLLRESKITSEWQSLLPLASGEEQPPVFFIHGWSGRILNYLRIVANFKGERNVWGVQALEISGDHPKQKCFEEMANSYIEEMIQVQPVGPYYLVGYSLAGLIAYEIAFQMQKRGLVIGRLIVIDSALHNLPPSLHAKAVLPMHMERAKNYLKRRLKNQGGSLKQDLEKAKRLLKIFKKVSQSKTQPLEKQEPNDQLDYYSRMARQYIPQLSRLPMTVIQSTQTKHHFKDSWPKLVEGKCEVIEMDEEHFDLIKDPAAGKIAKIIRERLSN